MSGRGGSAAQKRTRGGGYVRPIRILFCYADVTPKGGYG